MSLKIPTNRPRRGTMNKTAEKTKEITREPRPEKVELVAELKSLFETSQGVIFTEYRGLDVLSMKELRASLKSVGASYKVYKNTLIRRAVSELKMEDTFAELLNGPVGLAFVEPDADYSETARTLAGYKKDHTVFLIKGGYSDGELMDAATYEAFSKLPSLIVLQGQFASALQAPLSNLAGLMNSVLQKFAGQLSALRDKAEAEAPAPPAEETATEKAVTEEPAPEETVTEEPAPEKTEEESETATEDTAPEEAVQEETATQEEPKEEPSSDPEPEKEAESEEPAKEEPAPQEEEAKEEPKEEVSTETETETDSKEETN